jgi:hypothetical protein
MMVTVAFAQIQPIIASLRSIEAQGFGACNRIQYWL